MKSAVLNTENSKMRQVPLKFKNPISAYNIAPSLVKKGISATKKKGISNLDFLITFVFLCGLYTGIFFYFTDNLFIPFVICGLVAPYFLIKNIHNIRLSYLSSLIFIYAITMLGMAFSPEASEQFFERFKGFVQLIYSTSVGLLLFINMQKFQPKFISKLFMWFAILILVGTTLEVYTPFKYLSDEFRHFVFRTYIYESDIRDIVVYGLIRPKLFTSEPSHVAKFFLLSIFVWFSLSKQNWRYTIYIILNALGFVLIRSPIIVLCVPLAVIVEIFLRKSINLSSLFTKKKPVIKFSFAVLIIISILLILVSAVTILAPRIREVIEGKDGSFAGRITGPMLIAYSSVEEYPIWGVGITGKEAIYDVIIDSFFIVGRRESENFDAGCNFLMLFISYYGILGGSLFIVGLIALIKRLKIKNGMFVTLSIVIFSQTMGGFVGLRTWGYIFIILLVARYSNYSAKNSIIAA